MSLRPLPPLEVNNFVKIHINKPINLLNNWIKIIIIFAQIRINKEFFPSKKRFFQYSEREGEYLSGNTLSVFRV